MVREYYWKSPAWVLLVRATPRCASQLTSCQSWSSDSGDDALSRTMSLTFFILWATWRVETLGKTDYKRSVEISLIIISWWQRDSDFSYFLVCVWKLSEAKPRHIEVEECQKIYIISQRMQPSWNCNFPSHNNKLFSSLICLEFTSAASTTSNCLIQEREKGRIRYKQISNWFGIISIRFNISPWTWKGSWAERIFLI